MSLDREHKDGEPVTSVDPLVAHFRAAERPKGPLLLGLEHEKLLYPKGSPTPVPYEGPQGIRALLEGLTAKGHQPFREHDAAPPIALLRGRETVSLEPGGQLELSGSPFATAREAHAENLRHVAEVKDAGAALGLFPVDLGYRPFEAVADVPWVPKTRYAVMKEVLGPRGRYALDMMLMTATAQVSLDWQSEADCARKVTLTSRISPLLVALYANSPLRQGAPSGFMSFRSQVWTDVDRSRCGYFPAMLDGTFSYQAYTDWALDAPLLFLRRHGEYLRPNLTFRQLLKDGFDRGPAYMADWVDHLSTLFPEVRIKRVMEVRAADAGSLARVGALPALFRGLLYDGVALSEAEALLPRLSFAEHLAFQATARKEGLRGLLANRTLGQWCRDLVGIAQRGLKRLDPADAPLLQPLVELAASARSPAERVLELHARFRGEPGRMLEACAL